MEDANGDERCGPPGPIQVTMKREMKRDAELRVK